MVTALDKNTALILIDLQKSIVQNPAIKDASQVLQQVTKLVDAFRRQGLPIVVVNVNPAGAVWTRSRKDARAAQQPPRPDALEITPEVVTQPGDIFITKRTWGAFYETALDETLRQRAVTGIVLAGISTSIGVEGTARGASERGYNIAFARDAMTDSVPDAHERSLKYIFPRIGEVDDTDRIIEKLIHADE